MTMFTLTAYGLYSPLDALGALAMGARRNRVPLIDWATGKLSSVSGAFPTLAEVSFDEKRDVDDVVADILKNGLVEEKDGLRIVIERRRKLTFRKSDLSIFVPCDMKRFIQGLPQVSDRLNMKVNGDLLMRLKDYIGNEWTENGEDKRLIKSGSGHDYVYAKDRLQFLGDAEAAKAGDAKAVLPSLDFISRFEPDFSMPSAFLASDLRSCAAESEKSKGYIRSSNILIGSDVALADIEKSLIEAGCEVIVHAPRDRGDDYVGPAMLKVARNDKITYIGLNSAILMSHCRHFATNQPHLFSGTSVISYPSDDSELTRDAVIAIASIPSEARLIHALHRAIVDDTPIKQLNCVQPVESVTIPAAKHYAEIRGLGVLTAPRPQSSDESPSFVRVPSVDMVAPTDSLAAISDSVSGENDFTTQSEVVAYAVQQALPEAIVILERDPTGNVSADIVRVIEGGEKETRIGFCFNDQESNEVWREDMTPMTVTPMPIFDNEAKARAERLMNELFCAVPVADAIREQKAEAERKPKNDLER